MVKLFSLSQTASSTIMAEHRPLWSTQKYVFLGCFLHNSCKIAHVEFKHKIKRSSPCFLLLEAVPLSPEMSGWGFCVKYKCRELLYSPASLGNSLACCGNWRSWRSKHHLLWWKMRSRGTKRKTNWYTPLHRSKEQRLLLNKWVTTNNDLWWLWNMTHNCMPSPLISHFRSKAC